MSLAVHRLYKPQRLVFLKSLLGWMVLALGLSLCLSPARVRAQDTTEPKTGEVDKEPPPPEDITLKARVPVPSGDDEFVELHGKYYPGMKGEESIPVILVHGLGKKCSSKDFTQPGGLAEELQKLPLGCAVVVIDLRGYGDSIKPVQTGPVTEESDKTKKKAEEAKEKKHAEEFKKKIQGQVPEMVTEDLGAVKRFLWKKNNQKALNIDKLAVIGVEEGASLTLSYAAYDALGYDEGNGQPKVGPLKVGQFVKAVVLVSPVIKFKGSATSQAMKNLYVASELSVLILAGNKNRQYMAVAEALYNVFKKPPRENEEHFAMVSRSLLFLQNITTTLQGCKLVEEAPLKTKAKIIYFLKLRLVENPKAKEWVWKERKHPHE